VGEIELARSMARAALSAPDVPLQRADAITNDLMTDDRTRPEIREE